MKIYENFNAIERVLIALFVGSHAPAVIKHYSCEVLEVEIRQRARDNTLYSLFIVIPLYFYSGIESGNTMIGTGAHSFNISTFIAILGVYTLCNMILQVIMRRIYKMIYERLHIEKKGNFLI